MTRICFFFLHDYIHTLCCKAMVLTLFVALFSWKRQLLLKTGTKERLSEGLQITQKNRWTARPRKTLIRPWRGAVQTQRRGTLQGSQLVQVTFAREVSLSDKCIKKWAAWEQSAAAFGLKVGLSYVQLQPLFFKKNLISWIHDILILCSGGITAEVGTNGDRDHEAGTGRRRLGLAQGRGLNTVITAEVVARAGGAERNICIALFVCFFNLCVPPFVLNIWFFESCVFVGFFTRERKKRSEKVRRKSRSRSVNPPAFRGRNTAMDAQEALARRQGKS